jgi:hypothetical protein
MLVMFEFQIGFHHTHSLLCMTESGICIAKTELRADMRSCRTSYKLSATSDTFQGFTRMAPLSDGEHPTNSLTTRALLRGLRESCMIGSDTTGSAFQTKVELHPSVEAHKQNRGEQ